MKRSTDDQRISLTGLLEMCRTASARSRATASCSIKLARAAPEEDVAVGVLVAEAVLEFADALRCANRRRRKWPCKIFFRIWYEMSLPVPGRG
jgi:hypothetical protein